MLPTLLTQPTEQLTRDDLRDEVKERFAVALHAFVGDLGEDPDQYDFWVDGDGTLWAFQGHTAYEWDPANGEWLSDADNDDN